MCDKSAIFLSLSFSVGFDMLLFVCFVISLSRDRVLLFRLLYLSVIV